MARNTVWWVLGSVVVIGGGVGAYFLLRKDEGAVGGSAGDSGGGGSGGAFGASMQGLQNSDRPAFQRYEPPAPPAPPPAATANAAAPGPVGNAAAIPMARDVSTMGGREISGAGSVGTMPNSGLAGIDTTGIAASRNRTSTPTGTGPALVRPANKSLAAAVGSIVRQGTSSLSGAGTTGTAGGGITFVRRASAPAPTPTPAPTPAPPPAYTPPPPRQTSPRPGMTAGAF